MDTKERLKAIAGAKAISQEDKTFLLNLCVDLGIQVTNRRCRNCLQDAAIQCWKRLQPIKSKQNNVLKEDVDVFFNGIRVNNAVMTDKLLAYLKANNFPTKYYADK